MNRIQSEVVNSIKFPLIVLVVFIHTISNDIRPISLELSGNNLYTIISELISHNLGYIAVPCFFFISGYFLFNKIEEWSGRFYWNNLIKKTTTLLLPYIIWNMLYIFLIWIKVLVFDKLGFSIYEYERNVLETPIYEHLIHPINYPLWYVRDLICMNVISFALFFIIRRIHWGGIVLLYLSYLLGIESGVPGFSSTAILFVTSGAYMGYKQMDCFAAFASVRTLAFMGFIILLPVALCYNQQPISGFLIRLYIPLGVITIFNLAFSIYKHFPNVSATCIKLAPAVFFIYATHTIYIVNWVTGGLARLGCSEGISRLIPYFMTPMITIAVCGVGFVLCKKVFPRCLGVAMGGR